MNVLLGTEFNSGKEFSIDTSRHINLTGSSGVGKSTLLARLFVEHVRQGYGACLIDPHGDLCDAVIKLLPRSIARNVIWIDPDATHVPGLNIFDYDDPKDKELGVESFITMMKALAGTAWGDESARVLTNAADAIVEQYDRPTAIPVFRFMADDKFREKILSKSKHPLLRLFQQQYDEKLRDSEQMSKFSPPINKLGKLLRPAIIPIIGQPKSLDFLDVMNNNRVVICRFSKGRLGEETAQILGSLIVSMISISALKREKQKQRSPFMLLADEAHNFVHGGRFGTLLAESRKYAITLVLAEQGLYQMPFARDILANCPTQICFNVSGEDAKMMADNWRWVEYPDELRPEQITGLPRYQFYCRTFVNNEPKVFRVKSYPDLRRRGDEANPTKLIKASLQRWGTKRKDVEARIMKFLDS